MDNGIYKYDAADLAHLNTESKKAELNGVRYSHICRDCKTVFSNLMKHSDVCCVCEVRRIRDEWEN